MLIIFQLTDRLVVHIKVKVVFNSNFAGLVPEVAEYHDDNGD